jgi:O-antigen/teichoic acid export membrane protein
MKKTNKLNFHVKQQIFFILEKIKANPGFKRYGTNVLWMMGEKILRISVGLFVGVWVARFLGPKEFGIFSYANTVIFLFSAISTLGLDSIVVRELLSDGRRSNVLMGTTFGLKFAGAIITFPLLLLLLFFLKSDFSTSLIVFIIAISTVFQSFNVIDFYFQSKSITKHTALANTVSLAISSIVKIILIINNAELWSFALMVVVDSFVLASGLIFFYLKEDRNNFSSWKFEWKTAIALLKNSAPLILTGIVVSLYMKIDQVFIKFMLGDAAVGHYSVAVTLSEAWYFIPMAICNSLYPSILNSKKQGEVIYFNRLQKLYAFMIWLAVLIALPMTFLSSWIINILYGEKYYEAGTVLMVNIWSAVFVFLGVAFSYYLTAENLVYKSLYRTAAGAFINILLNFLLIPLYGIVGAAMATLAAQIVANYVYDFFDKDLSGQLHLKNMAFNPFYLKKILFK